MRMWKFVIILTLFVFAEAINVVNFGTQVERIELSLINRAYLDNAAARSKRSADDNPFAAMFAAKSRGSDANILGQESNDEISDQMAMQIFGSMFGPSQGGAGGGNFFQNAMCFQSCQPKLDKMKKYGSDEDSEEDEESIEWIAGSDFQEGSGEELFIGENEEGMRGEPARKKRKSKAEFNMKMPDTMPFGRFMSESKNESFNATEFNEMCVDFIDAKECLDQCGGGFFTDMLKGVFRPLEYMCIVEKDDFLKYVECAESADTTECDNKCGNSTYIEEKTKEAENINSLSDAMGNIGDMCNFVQCQLDCSIPKVVASCDNDKRAGEVFEGTLAHLIGGLIGTFESVTFGMAQSPPQCQMIIEKAPVLPSQIKEEISEELGDTEVLRERALELEIEKLQLEIENLKLEKQVLEMQIKKLQEEQK